MYQFIGFFARPGVQRPQTLPPRAIWRNVCTPFNGVGVYLPGLFVDEYGVPVGPLLAVEEIKTLATQFGFDSTKTWVYLEYVCWGGPIDFVYGVSMCEGVRLGPLKMSVMDGSAEEAFTTLMAHFGITPEDALNFAPFVRGYWGVL